jgi:hypothetical protein
MSKDFHYKNYYSLNEAFQIYNNIMPGEKFTLIDYNILSLARSFHDSGQKFYMSNDQLAAMFYACEKTIRSSINRLCKFRFLEKQNIDNNRLKGRYLIYHPWEVQTFITKMHDEAKPTSR